MEISGSSPGNALAAPAPRGRCAAERAVTLARSGQRLPDAVQEADEALVAPHCRSEPACVLGAVTTLVLAGEPAEAEEAAARLGRLPSTSDALAGRITLLRARTARWNGDLDTAWSRYRALQHTGVDPALRPSIVAETAELLLVRGNPAAAHTVLAAYCHSHGTIDAASPPALLGARGAVRMAIGDVRHALADHLLCGRRLTARGMVNPAFSAWRRRAARCAHALGDHRRATELAVEDYEAAMAWGEPKTLGEALHVLAVVGNPAAAVDLLREAVDLLDVAGAALEAGEARYELGVRFAAAGQPTFAREQFREAAARFRWAGCTAQAVHAEAELAGLQPPIALTMPETRVALLAIAGYSNRDIAARLYVAVRTVEFHLSHVYRKLGIRGRAELRAGLLEIWYRLSGNRNRLS
ncbi:helix-turn-helix transcriptional regulator [Amycolatopsis jejuensis]|uniref:helix-turn-helix transcriptional regulator n=1 Tax=Amycolatopsis jejuensis TaxID=330084 RepID=UPI000B2D2929|nr:helix-turn-helix transcriptional regulator [Amycolatopsis jejuensis]